MPIIPTLSNAPQQQNLPDIQSVRPDPDAFGASLGESITHAATSLGSAFMQYEQQKKMAQQRRDTEAADKALTAYTSEMDGLINGTLDAQTGQTIPGLSSRRLAEAQNSARDFTQAERDYLNNPESPYAKLTQSQRQIFESAAQKYSQRFRSAMIDHELTQTQAQRKVDRQAAFTTADRLAQNAYRSSNADEFFGEASMRFADAQLGDQVSLNPDGTRSFSSPTAESLWKETSAKQSLSYKMAQADHFTALASDLPLNDPNANELIQRAQNISQSLPPELSDKINQSIKHSETIRLSREKSALLEAERAKRAAEDQAEQALAERWQKALTTQTFDDSLISELSKSPATKQANQYIQQTLAIQQRITEDQKKSVTEKQNINNAFDTALNIADLDAGYKTHQDGTRTPMTLQERKEQATALFLVGEKNGGLSYSQWQERIRNIDRDSDARIQTFSNRALREVLPDLFSQVQTDPQGRFIPSDKIDPKTKKPLHTLDSILPLEKDTYTTPDGKSQKKKILLRDALDALNTVKDRLSVDPTLSPDAAYDLYKNLMKGTLEESTRLTIQEEIEKQASIVNKLRSHYNSKSPMMLIPPTNQNP